MAKNKKANTKKQGKIFTFEEKNEKLPKKPKKK